MKRSYEDSVHFMGRIWMVAALAIMYAVPIVFSLFYGVWPDPVKVLQGLLGVAPIFWTVCAIEVFTYAPMLGNAGTYLGFVTGNLTNLKVPCALSAMEGAAVAPGSDEGEVISTIAIAVSSITTTLIIVAGVLLLIPLTPLLESPTLKPAFDNILPALFGGLGVVYISKSWKIAATPLLAMILLFILVPSLAGSVGILVPVATLISIGTARLLYKKNLL